MLTDTEILEAASLGSALDSAELKGLRYKVRLIEGDKLGSTGYYPAETLLRDGPKIFKKGTPMFLNHQTPDQKITRPFGSIEEYAGELAEDAYYENDGLYAEVEVFEHEAPRIKALKDRIGISIRAKGRSIVENINGKAVPVFKELTEARSADFVMRAGAGGKIVSILESANVDSETASEAEEESKDNMDEVLEAIKALKSDVDARFTALEEAAKPVEEEAVEEGAVDYDKVLEIAEAFVSSSLDAEGRSRVLDLHRANKKPLAELIEAEEAYVKKSTKAVEGAEGIEESADEEVEESAKIKLPSAWKKKDK
jgi:hypothetical protein